MSEETNTWEQRAKLLSNFYKNALADPYLMGYLKGIEEYKEALKKEIEKEILINDNILKSKDRRTFGYLIYCNSGLKKTLELIDTAKPQVSTSEAPKVFIIQEKPIETDTSNAQEK